MNYIKRFGKSALRRSIRIARKSGAVRRVLDDEASKSLALDPRLYEGRDWIELDHVYTICRRLLQARPEWRHGPARVYEVAREAFDAMSPHVSVADKSYCDLGCGVYHPYGISTIVYLNGAQSAIASISATATRSAPRSPGGPVA